MGFKVADLAMPGNMPTTMISPSLDPVVRQYHGD